MVKRIDQDHKRFRQIVRGSIKKDLKKYITQGELIGKRGKNIVSIPIPHIDIPRFRYDTRQSGIGQGDGDAGDDIGIDPGILEGQHLIEVDVPLEELAAILGEELELPRIQPRGKNTIRNKAERYKGIYNTGPESLRHFKRTFKEALKRQIASGTYDPENPIIVPVGEDRRYRSRKITAVPESSAVIIYGMDVSGSMGDEQKEIVRTISFWIDTWLSSQYKGLEKCYVVHDVTAKEVDGDTFFHTRESGGTKISSAYRLFADIIDQRYNPNDWNIYSFHFSDGENSDSKDTMACMEILEKDLFPKINMFCYGQVKSSQKGDFLNNIKDYFSDEEKVVTSEIGSREEIYNSIKTFLGKGR